MNTHIEAVLFDNDGVIANSEELWTEIDTQFLSEHGIAYAGEHKTNIIGTSFPSAVGFYRNRYGLQPSIEELVQRRHAIADDFYTSRIELFPDVTHVLKTLHARGIRIALGTSAIRALAEPFLQRHGIHHYFDAITTGDDVAHGKPAPDIYLNAAEKLGVAPANCLVVEDALAGVEAGKSAGMRVAAIPDERWNDVTKYHGYADFVMKNLGEVPDLVEKLNATKTAS
ncbi:MAG TPA: HAD family phosphatase [Abditibacteriaceae bacterium]|jgi:HAD superfamily hydrolase (TIGR01509 family)